MFLYMCMSVCYKLPTLIPCLFSCSIQINMRWIGTCMRVSVARTVQKGSSTLWGTSVNPVLQSALSARQQITASTATQDTRLEMAFVSRWSAVQVRNGGVYRGVCSFNVWWWVCKLYRKQHCDYYSILVSLSKTMCCLILKLCSFVTELQRSSGRNICNSCHCSSAPLSHSWPEFAKHHLREHTCSTLTSF